MRLRTESLFPLYPHRPIGSIRCLALLLKTSPETLQALADSAHGMYRPVPQKKKDGATRMTYDAHTPLKRVQHLIVVKILRQVHYPRYLQGAIRDRQQPRDQVSNSAQHASARILVLDDIKDFFPSLNEKLVFDIWRRFCGFSPEVAELLTKLTTYQGTIPQGAKTSSYLANLAFWDIEGFQVDKLQSMGFTYTRFVDDVTISTRTFTSNQAVAAARSMVYGMLASKGCRPKRTKSHVGRKGQQLIVTGLVTNGASPVVEKSERKRIRAAVHNLERTVQNHGWTPGHVQAWHSTKGRVLRLVRLNPCEGIKLKRRLEAIDPQAIHQIV